MIDATPLLRLYAHRRLRALASLDPVQAQKRTLDSLVHRAGATRFGRDHGFDRIGEVAAFQARVPLRRYEDFWRDYWQAAFPVLTDVSWPGTIPFFAVTSGTTTGATKYIPWTRAMNGSNLRAGLQLLSHHLAARPASRIGGGRSFMLGGSTALEPRAPGVTSGDLSGIATRTMPFWARPWSFPPPDLALMEDWEKKVDILARRSRTEPIRVLTGTPSWLLILLDRVAALNAAAGKPSVPAYPELDLLIHGGVNFEPYRPQFEALIDADRTDMREVYPASEGFFAVADRHYGDGLRLMVDSGLFFEFVPVEELDAPSPTRLWLATVEAGVNYALAVSNCAGLWSYIVGDTVRFVETRPPRLLITGRTAYMLSAFGEHLIGEEIEHAVSVAAERIGTTVRDFSVGALFPEASGDLGAHLFIVEFADGPPPPDRQAAFLDALDRALGDANDDYRAHRAGGFGLDAPRLLAVVPGTFAAWMKGRGKLGGQNKVPRVIADQTLFGDLRAFCGAL